MLQPAVARGLLREEGYDHLGDLLVDEDDGDALALLVDHAVVVALDLALGLLHRRLRLVPDLRVVHLLGHQVLVALQHLEARLVWVSERKEH